MFMRKEFFFLHFFIVIILLEHGYRYIKLYLDIFRSIQRNVHVEFTSSGMASDTDVGKRAKGSVHVLPRIFFQL